MNLTLTRVSGDISNWKRVNRRFMNTLRKQFLIWRTLNASERDRYLEEMELQGPLATDGASSVVGGMSPLATNPTSPEL